MSIQCSKITDLRVTFDTDGSKFSSDMQEKVSSVFIEYKGVLLR